MRTPAKFQYMRGVMLKQETLQCGLCHMTHETRAAAQSCVYHCLIKRNSKEPVQQVAEQKSRKFRCRYCCREYTQMANANKCVSSCLKDYHEKIKHLADELEAEALANELKKEALAAEAALQAENAAHGLADEDKFFRDQAKYACKNCHKTYFSKRDVVMCFDGHNT